MNQQKTSIQQSHQNKKVTQRIFTTMSKSFCRIKSWFIYSVGEGKPCGFPTWSCPHNLDFQLLELCPVQTQPQLDVIGLKILGRYNK